MVTEVSAINAESLQKAKEILTSGGLVGMPTETVYGLAADARSAQAVQEVFRVKGRPQDNPLIVHVHENFDLSTLVEISQDYVYALLRAFTPGPITLVLKSKNVVAPQVSCGLDSLAVRIPSHAGAQAFLSYVNMPIAAPSANLSKHTSPVTAAHVLQDFSGKIPLILDGGRCSGGIESTVINVMGEVPVILRSGLITKEDVIRVVGKCEYAAENAPIRSPGMKYRHYHPLCETAMFPLNELSKATALAASARKEGKRVLYLASEEAQTALFALGEKSVLSLGKTEEEIARNVYYLLHEAEEKCDLLIAIAMEERGALVGVMNRLKKACAP